MEKSNQRQVEPVSNDQFLGKVPGYQQIAMTELDVGWTSENNRAPATIFVSVHDAGHIFYRTLKSTQTYERSDRSHRNHP